MTGLDERARTALQPLREALLAAARTEARAIEASAEADSQELHASAVRERDAVLDEARARGAADGALRLQTERARAQREARGVVLAARRAAYDELRRRSAVAVRELLEDPAERARLATVLRERLGAEAVVRDHPAGGLVGHSADGRVVDASVGALVESALAAFDLESMWAPTAPPS